MASTIKLKNGSGAPLAGDLVQGEPALDLTNKRLYTEDSLGNVIEVGINPSSLTIGGTALTATAAELNTLDGITATTAELNTLDGITATVTELNYTDGVTSNIQTQLNTKAPIASPTFTGTVTAPAVNVNGTVTADGLTVDGSVSIESTSSILDLMETDATDVNTRIQNSGGDFLIRTLNDAKTAVSNRLLIDHATGDISFYEDTGTTAKFFWDASTERLGIGTTSPQSSLHITDFDAIIKLESSSSARIQFTESDVADKDFHIVLNNGSFLFNEVTSAGTFVSTPFLIEGGSQQNSIYVASSGNVGLRTSSPLAPLHVNNNAGVYVGSTPGYHLTLKATQTPAVTVGGSTITGLISTSGTGSASGHVGIEIPANDSNDGFYIATDSDLDGTVDKLAMKINAAGQVGINFNDPRATLDVHGSMRHITGTLGAGALNGIKWNFTCTNTGSDYNDTWLLAGTVNIAEGNYKAASIHYVMQYPENNFGNTTKVEEYRGVIKITRTSSTTQDDPANAEIYGPDMSPVELRVYKVSAGVYEIQVKNTQANKYFSFDFMQTCGSGGIDVPLPNQGINYYASQATLTGGTEYTRQRSSTLGMRQTIDAKNIHASEGIYLGGIVSNNLLDDYEEGTFVPVVEGSTTAGTGTYSTQTGYYTKVGNVVTAHVTLQWSAHTGTGDMLVKGFPFNPASTHYFTPFSSALLLSSGYRLQGVITSSGTSTLYQTDNSVSGATTVPMDSGALLGFTLVYRTS